MGVFLPMESEVGESKGWWILKLKIIHIEWEDAKATYGWHSTDEIVKRTFPVTTVGILIHEDAESITVSTSYARATGDWADPITIPKRCINKRKTLMVLK